jgi:hypothetical protein
MNKLTFEIVEDAYGAKQIVPVDQYGSRIAGVIECTVDSAQCEVSTMTMKIIVLPKGN